jgi:phosphoglucosamine mutase
MKKRFFGSSGIRGIANLDITPHLALLIGQAVVTSFGEGTYVLGRDARLTGPMLESSLSSGIRVCGGDVLMGGLIPTPVAAWEVVSSGSKSGVAITASHNPPEYNGFKLFNPRGMSFTGEDRAKIESILIEDRYHLASWDGMGAVKDIDARLEYIKSISSFIELSRDWRIICDCFCGASGVIVPELFGELGIKSTNINAQPDGHFPAGTPEPNSETLSRLGSLVKGLRGELGFGFDGDGDRMLAVNEEGKPVSPDRLLAAYAGYICEKEGGGAVVTHVGCSMSIDYMVQKAGGTVVRTRVGDAYIAEKIVKNNAIFGGEPVGAWIHPDVHLCPDGILSALKIMEALENEEATLSEFLKPVPVYPISRYNLECPENRKSGIMEHISEKYGDVFNDIININLEDGIRLETSLGWILLRTSGTEPLIRITVEGKNTEDTEELMKKGIGLVKSGLEAMT